MILQKLMRNKKLIKFNNNCLNVNRHFNYIRKKNNLKKE